MDKKKPGRQKQSTGNVKGKLKVTSTGAVTVEATVPTEIVHGLGANLKKFFQGTVAMIAPDKYLRTTQVLARGKLTAALADRLADDLDDPDAAKVLACVLNANAAELVGRYGRRQEIVNQAVEDVHLLGPPQSTVAPVSDEFVSHFWNAADRATTTEVRALFARILAKESIEPGSYSASTLNLLAIIHPALAHKFQLFCRMSFGYTEFDFVVVGTVHGESPATKSNSIGITNKNGEQLAQFGIELQDLLEMRAAGLTRSLPGEEYPNLANFFANQSVELAGQHLIMKVSKDAPAESGFTSADSTNVISLTRAGSELRSILALEPHAAYKQRLIQVMALARVALNDR